VGSVVPVGWVVLGAVDVFVGVCVGVIVGVDVRVAVGVAVDVEVEVGSGSGVDEGVGVLGTVAVKVAVSVAVGVLVSVPTVVTEGIMDVCDGVGELTGVNVIDGDAEAVQVGVKVGLDACSWAILTINIPAQ